MIRKLSFLFTCVSIFAHELDVSQKESFDTLAMRGSEQKDVRATVCCAFMLATGNGIQRDDALAVLYLKSAIREAYSRVSEPHLLESIADVLILGLNSDNLGQDETRAAIFKDKAAERRVLLSSRN